VDQRQVERRLAAIVAADVAGYSRLMGADEEGTLAQLKAHRRALVDPKIREHRGRIVKTTGDGLLRPTATCGPSNTTAFSTTFSMSRGARQGVDERASGRFTSIAAAHRVRQHTLHGPEIGNLRLDIRKVARRELMYFGASVLSVLGGKSQQRANFIEGKPKLWTAVVLVVIAVGFPRLAPLFL